MIDAQNATAPCGREPGTVPEAEAGLTLPKQLRACDVVAILRMAQAQPTLKDQTRAAANARS
jgi:hypothetical protein